LTRGLQTRSGDDHYMIYIDHCWTGIIHTSLSIGGTAAECRESMDTVPISSSPARVRSPDCLAQFWSLKLVVIIDGEPHRRAGRPSTSHRQLIRLVLRDPSDQIKFLVHHTEHAKIPSRHFFNITTTCLFVWRTRKSHFPSVSVS
jgi:hypothetical protein